MPEKQINRDNIVEFLLDLFERRGPESYIGENVSMADHMEQTAACAVKDGASDSLVVASLLHDIGHFVSDFPLDASDQGIDNVHEDAAALMLEKYYPKSVSEPIKMHVAAKRYMCAVDNSYFDRLSQASVISLKLQGGPMSGAEVAEFEKNPYKDDAVKLRSYDDDGKIIGLTINQISHYRPLLESLRLS